MIVFFDVIDVVQRKASLSSIEGVRDFGNAIQSSAEFKRQQHYQELTDMGIYVWKPKYVLSAFLNPLTRNALRANANYSFLENRFRELIAPLFQLPESRTSSPPQKKAKVRCSYSDLLDVARNGVCLADPLEENPMGNFLDAFLLDSATVGSCCQRIPVSTSGVCRDGTRLLPRRVFSVTKPNLSDEVGRAKILLRLNDVNRRHF